MDSPSVVDRIRETIDTCTEQERYYFMKILEELATSEDGRSKTYEDVWLSDYKEIPVGINTFLNSDTYLGKTNRNGASVYPFWRKELNTVFDAGNKYYEWILTGATRIGKSSTAVTAIAYMLYKLMCLRDPQRFFGKKDISKFSILFFNLTLELAKSVSYREFNDMLKASPWFSAHGNFSKSEENFYYIPEGGKIDIDCGSSFSAALGKQVFCLIGETKVLTNYGILTLADMSKSDDEILVVSYNPESKETELRKNSGIILTKYVTDTISIELEDGTVIEGTPDHMVLMSDWRYKMLCDMTMHDRIFDVKYHHYSEVVCFHKHHYDEPIPVYDVVNVEDNHNFVIVGNSGNFVSHNCCMLDEVNFSAANVRDINKAKQRVKESYDVLAARVKGTFKHGGEVFGKIFAVSSKKSDQDFMNDHIATQMSSGGESFMYISDAPQWEVLPPETFSDKKFYVAVGGRHQRGFVVPENQEHEAALRDIEAQGFKLLHIPIDMRSDFLADFDVALRDIAGISVPGAMSFITQDAIDKCIDSTRRNPFYTDTIQIGKDDNYAIEEFCHINEIPPNILHAPTYIHLDMALVNDRAGISGVSVTGRKDLSVGDKVVSVPTLSHSFSIGIEAPRGSQISFQKVMLFITWLRDQGMNIQIISRDTFQSEYLGQQLEARGFKVEVLSLDRTNDGYITFRSILIEQRIALLDHKLLQDELIHLQRDSVSQKVDHPSGGSKDIADSVAGATWNAVRSNPDVPIQAQAKISAISAVNGLRGRNSGYRGIQLPSMFPNYRKLR